MTREEAIAFFKDMNECTYGNLEAVEMAIQALEQQPCEDCISRQRVLDIINFEYKWLLDAKVYDICTSIAFSAIMSKISEMPSVTLRTNLAETSQDCISREAVIDHINLYPKIIDKYTAESEDKK